MKQVDGDDRNRKHDAYSTFQLEPTKYEHASGFQPSAVVRSRMTTVNGQMLSSVS